MHIQDLLDKFVLVPIEVNRSLRLMRQLDKKVEAKKKQVAKLQAQLIDNIKADPAFVSQQTEAAQKEYENVQKKMLEIHNLNQLKIHIAQQLDQAVEIPKKRIEEETRRANPEDKDDFFTKFKKKLQKKNIVQKKDDALQTQLNYDKNHYCYCGNQSYGEMVACQNSYCQRQWFHTQCLDQKNFPQKWYCKDCQKLKQKLKNTSGRYFI